MERLRETVATATRTELVLAALLITAICVCWLLANKGNRLLECPDCQPSTISNPNNTSTRSGNPQVTLTLYYATWCGYSRQFLPVWDRFAQYARTNLANINLAKVKCEGDTESYCSQKGVAGYPTIILTTPEGEPVTFNGDRTVEGLTQFCQPYNTR